MSRKIPLLVLAFGVATACRQVPPPRITREPALRTTAVTGTSLLAPAPAPTPAPTPGPTEAQDQGCAELTNTTPVNLVLGVFALGGCGQSYIYSHRAFECFLPDAQRAAAFTAAWDAAPGPFTGENTRAHFRAAMIAFIVAQPARTALRRDAGSLIERARRDPDPEVRAAGVRAANGPSPGDRAVVLAALDDASHEPRVAALEQVAHWPDCRGVTDQFVASHRGRAGLAASLQAARTLRASPRCRRGG